MPVNLKMRTGSLAHNGRALCLCLNLKNRCSKYILNFNKDKMIQTTTSAGIAQNPMLSAALSVRDANYLIAAFMGYENFRQTGAVIKDASMKFVLCYDSMWAEIMPVIEKIEAIKTNEWQSYGDFYVTTSQCSCRIHKLNNKPVAEANGYTKIEAVFEAVTKFIQWFNANNAAVLGSR